MGGTLTRDEWLKLREGNDTPRGVGNIVTPLAHQVTEEERKGDFWTIWNKWNEKHPPTSSADASQSQSDQSKTV